MSNPELTGSSIGRYEVGEKLGAGGMGEVYRAWDTQLHRNVALKFLPADLSRDAVARARFLREAQAASALEHPNIETVYGIGDHGGRMYIAMPLYAGETLADRMSRGPIPVDECESIIRQLLEACAAAHAAGVVHRDLKPANVMLPAAGSAAGHSGHFLLKVVDFGLAKTRSSGSESATRLTQQGAVMGTVAYMSPEQARGDTVDQRSDLWSVGVMAYEMLAGRHPFQAPSSVGTLTRIATEDPEALGRLRPEVPARLRRLVEGLLRKDREQRFATADQALEVLGGTGTVAPLRGPRAALRLWPLYAVLGVGLVVSLALLVPRWVGGRGAAARGDNSFVVLPCKVFGPDDWQYLADAVPSTLSNLLSQIEGIDTRRPPTRTEVDPFALPLDELERLARAYRVRNCMTCSVDVTGQRLLLNIELVEPETGNIIGSWAPEGTRDVDDYIDLIRRAAREIRDKLLPGTTTALTATTVASGSEAELAFQRGKYHSERYNNRREPRDLDLALEAFERALALEPGLADAAGEIAILELWSAESPEEIESRVKGHAERALRIDEGCSRAWTALAFIDWNERRTPSGLDHALKAIRHGPDDGLAYWPLYGMLKLYSNELALEAVRKTTDANPLYAWGYIGQASALFQQGSIERALERLDRALEIEPGMYAGNAYRAVFLATAGRLDEARQAFATIEGSEGASPPYLWDYARFALDLAASAPRQRPAVLSAFDARRCREFQCLDETYRFLTPILLQHGAVDLVVEAIDEYASFGFRPAYDWLMLNPALGPLRDDPRFGAIETASREQFVEWRAVLEAERERGELPDFLVEPLDDLQRRLPPR